MQKSIILSFLCIALCTFLHHQFKPSDNLSSNQEAKDFYGTSGDRLIKHLKLKKGDIDDRALFKLRKRFLKYHKSKHNENQKDAGLKSWQFIGPENIGGRVRAIAIVPNKINPTKEDIILGTASGGIWTSRDQGASWQPNNDFMSAMSFYSLAVHPTNPDTIYAGSGEGGWNTALGAGVFRSDDRGYTWTQLPATDRTEFARFNKVVIDPKNPSTIYDAVIHDINKGSESLPIFVQVGVIYKSNDSGQTWNAIDTVDSQAYDIEIDPNNSNKLILGMYNDVRVSTDGGMTFVSVVGGNQQLPHFTGRAEISYSSGSNNVVYATLGKNKGQLWRSLNGGQTWQPRDTTSGLLLAQTTYNNALFVDPLNNDNVLVGGVRLQRSTTGGSNFSIQALNNLHVDIHSIVPSHFYSLSNPVIYVGCDGGIYRNDNIWAAPVDSAWTNLANNSLGITQFYSGTSDPYGITYAGGTQDNSNVFGHQNEKWNTATGGDGIEFIINPKDTNIYYNSDQFGFIARNDDSGRPFNWKFLALFNLGGWCHFSPSFGACPGDTIGVYYINNSDTLFVVNDSAPFESNLELDVDSTTTLFTGGRRLWKSTNSGRHWAKVKFGVPGFNQIISAIATNLKHQLVMVGYYSGRVEISKDGGSSWSGPVNTQNMPTQYVTDIEINPIDPSKILISYGGFIDHQIWMSEDTGMTWQTVALPMPIHVNSVAWHPTIPGWIYAGTDFGIFASEDSGQNWNVNPIYSFGQETHSNDGPVFVEVTDLFWQGLGTVDYPYHLCAATYGRGIWRSKEPILEIVYVDKNCSPCGKGTISEPYSTLSEAVQKTGSGVTIQFLSEMTHDEAGPSILITDRKMVFPPANKKVVIE